MTRSGAAASDRAVPPTGSRSARTGPRPLRVTPIPRREPPTISADEAYAPPPPPTGYVQGRLEMSGLGSRDAPAHPGYDGEDLDELRPRPTARLDLPEPAEAARTLGQALVEVMWGARPAPQLVRWTSPDVYAVVARRALVASRRELRTGRPPVVRRVRVCEPADGVAEVSLVIVAGDRVRAMALRLVGLDGRWVVTELQLG